jgi:hypothetical protein
LLSRIESIFNQNYMRFALFQRLQDLERVLRAAVVYVAFTTKVLVFCWLGSELSDQESITE